MFHVSKPKEPVFQKFSNAIKILLINSQIFGLVTITSTPKTFQPSKIKCIWNVAILCIYTSTIAYIVYLTVAEFIETTGIQRTTNTMVMISSAVYLGTVWVSSITKSDQFVKFLMTIVDLDEKLFSNDIRLDYDKTKKHIVLQMVARKTLFVFYFGFFIIVDLQYRDFNSYLMECSALFMLVMNSALCFLVIELIHILRARFKVLNQHINTLAQQGTKKTRKQGILPLNKICTLHHHLSKLIKSFNEIFGVILLLMFTLSFLVIVLSLFYTTAELQSSVIVWMDAFYAFMTSVTFIIDTIYVCDACYSTIQEVDPDFVGIFLDLVF
jgi:hypothetical protein